MSTEPDMANAEIIRRLMELAAKTDVLNTKIDTKFEALDLKFLSMNEYRANQETAAELRRSLAEEVTVKVVDVGGRVAALENKAKARAGVIASALVALMVAVIAAGLTKGFGL